ncbi:G patch domain-containing protein 1 [Dorcoceras hygrometricum]|uniref:G patch domain-containing protein 1 n=1 Tax=Dorcoceras hygrometricum TaxID=472368 RepID=A0A2Z7AP21_9LAMI|nr:G patch domain-containing protein 1 [Dorcoceras hygrometricum]
MKNRSSLMLLIRNYFSQEYVLNPKQDLYGLGYDPFRQAPEFREKKRLRYSGKLEMDQRRPHSMKRKAAPGFGIGALEDLDAEDEDIYDSVYDFEDTYVQEIEEPSRSMNVDNLKIVDTKKLKILDKETDVLPGFKVASNADGQPERFEPPEIPKDFLPHHKFPAGLGCDDRVAKISPPEVPPPEDNNLKVLIEGMATLVARCGKLFEDLSREKNQLNPMFAFLSGGNGCDFYARKLWEQHQKLAEKSKLGEFKVFNDVEKLTAESRGKILGEKPLDRKSNDSSSIFAAAGSVTVQFKLSDTFIQPSSLSEEPQSRKPFSDDPAKQIRFEQFLKEKYEGGLRTKDFCGSSKMSEAARARERLEFEDAAEAMNKGKTGKENQAASQLLSDLAANAGLQFTSGGVQGEKGDKTKQDEELITKSMYPKREEFQWRPAPILCKRFDLVDPYMGKPPAAPRMRSKMDTLIGMPNFTGTVTAEEHVAAKPAPSLVPQGSNEMQNLETPEMKNENEVEAGNVERPVDLYKAIFSDDSDEEVENTMAGKVEDRKKITEAATTTLNHLIAGDFLESLGRELGLEVPPDLPQSVTKAGTRPVEKKSVNALKQTGDLDLPSTEKLYSNMPNTISSLAGPFVTESKERDRRPIGDMNKESRFEDIYREDRTLDTVKHISRGSNSLSEDGKCRKHSRGSQRNRNSRSRSPETDTSDTSRKYRDRYHSNSKRKRKGSSRDKSGSRKRAEDHKHRSNDSLGRSHRSSRKELG